MRTIPKHAIYSAVFASALATSALAQAGPREDQAAAKRAASLLHQDASVLVYCEPCGDPAPGMPFRPNSLGATTALGATSFAITIGGQQTPLHHLYLRTDDASFRNLATLVDLPAHGAPPALSIHVSGDGEVISAPSSRAVSPKSPERPVALEPVPPMAQAEGSEGTTTELPQKNSGSIFGLVLLGLGLSSIASGGMLWLLWLMRLHRRRDLEPRALRLLK